MLSLNVVTETAERSKSCNLTYTAALSADSGCRSVASHDHVQHHIPASSQQMHTDVNFGKTCACKA